MKKNRIKSLLCLVLIAVPIVALACYDALIGERCAPPDQEQNWNENQCVQLLYSPGFDTTCDDTPVTGAFGCEDVVVAIWILEFKYEKDEMYGINGCALSHSTFKQIPTEDTCAKAQLGEAGCNDEQ